MATSRGIRGAGFPGVITSSISFCDSMGLIIIKAELTAEKAIPAARPARFPFR
jgi:hypothetical protein